MSVPTGFNNGWKKKIKPQQTYTPKPGDDHNCIFCDDNFAYLILVFVIACAVAGILYGALAILPK